VVSVVTPAACVAVGLARYAARQRLDQLSRQRRPDDGGLSYQRVMAPRLDLRGGGRSLGLPPNRSCFISR